MRYPIKFFIFCLLSLQSLCMPNMSNDKSCKPKTCKAKYSSKAITIKFPFFLKGGQPEYCGLPGFELYCDDQLGTLLELSHAGNFTVDAISYDYIREIQLSDPNKCLVQKMLLLSLANTPFQPNTPSTIFSLYNCSGNDDYYGSDFRFGGFYNNNYFKISCLSVPNYTIAAGKNPSSTPSDSRCKFVKIVSAPISDYYMLYYYSPIIRLTWDDPKCRSCDDSASSSKAWLGGILAVVLSILIISAACMWRGWQRSSTNAAAPIVASAYTNHAYSPRHTHDEPQLDHIAITAAPIVTSTYTNQSTSPRHTHEESELHHIAITTAPTVTSTDTNSANSSPRHIHDGSGLGYNSYLTMVIGESRRLIKPDDDKCSICLSDYSPGDTLEIIPCLHRFHADCINIWLRTNHTCPICRTSLP